MMPALIDHLWQSSLVVGLAWVLTALLRRQGAHLRYWIWLAASIKFLVPFSLLVFIGEQIGAGIPGGPVAVLSNTAQMAAPLAAPASFMVSADNGGAGMLQSLVLLVWAIGFAALVLRWFLRWRELRAIVRSAVPSTLVAPIPVLNSPTLLEPGVFGIRSPVLLLPKAIAAQLEGPQLRAILEHEFCHVRRHDNLTTSLHMLVESLFWFHPFVWWIGARLIHERERACDEAVMRSGHEAEAYAQGILKVCRHYVASNLACVSGVSGADLQTRLEAIMKNETIAGVSRAKRLLLGSFAVALLAVPVFVGLTFSSGSQAQTPNAKAVSNPTVGKIQMLDGKRVRLKYQNADVRALLKALAEAARVNMLVSDKVGGTVTLDLAEMPWDQALSVVLNAMGLVKHEKDGIIFVEPASA